jgi:hypothetical protein
MCIVRQETLLSFTQHSSKWCPFSSQWVWPFLLWLWFSSQWFNPPKPLHTSRHEAVSAHDLCRFGKIRLCTPLKNVHPLV